MEKKRLKIEIDMEFGSGFQMEVFNKIMITAIETIGHYFNGKHRDNMMSVKFTGSAVEEYYKDLYGGVVEKFKKMRH